MNNLILIISLLFSFTFLYLLHKKKVGPSNIFVLSFLVPSILVVIYKDYFSTDISINTILVLNILIAMFSIGEFSQSTKRKKLCKKVITMLEFHIGKKLFYIFILVIIVNLYIQYRYLMQIGSLMGASNLISAYAVSRLALVEYQNTGNIEVQMPYYGILISLIASCIEICCLHIYVYNKAFKGINDTRLIVIIALYFLSLLFSTGRAAFIPVFIHAIYVTLIFYGLKMSIRTVIKKYYKKIIVVVLLFFAVFLMLGAIRQNVDGEKNMEIDSSFTLKTYIAAPVLGLDMYINGGMQRGEYIGEHTFKDFYDYARMFGVPYKRTQFHKEDFYVGKGSSNVYTGIYYWLSDFSFLGACFYSLFLGMIVGYFYYRRSNCASIARIYLGSYLYYSLLLMFYNDQFNAIFSVLMIFKIMVIVYIQKKCLVVRTCINER